MEQVTQFSCHIHKALPSPTRVPGFLSITPAGGVSGGVGMCNCWRITASHITRDAFPCSVTARFHTSWTAYLGRSHRQLSRHLGLTWYKARACYMPVPSAWDIIIIYQSKVQEDCSLSQIIPLLYLVHCRWLQHLTLTLQEGRIHLQSPCSAQLEQYIFLQPNA